MNHLAHAGLSLMGAAGFPNPTSQQPPGVAGLVQLLGWTLWGFSLLCVGGIIVAAGKIIVAHHQGRTAGGGVVMVLVAAIIGMSAAPILNVVAHAH